MLSNTSKYAVRSVIYLAVNAGEERKIGIKKIADDLKIPAPFLGKILQTLVKHKLLSSTKGPNGGVSMAKNWEKVTIYQIITIMDGDALFESCLLGSGRCEGQKKKSGYCAMHNDFDAARQEMIKIYKSRTLKELSEQANNGLDNIQF